MTKSISSTGGGADSSLSKNPVSKNLADHIQTPAPHDQTSHDQTPIPTVQEVRQAVRQQHQKNQQPQQQKQQDKDWHWRDDWDSLWASIVSQFRGQFGDTTYRRFLQSLTAVDYQNSVFTFSAESFFQAEWVKNYYYLWLFEKFQMAGWQISQIDFVVTNGTTTHKKLTPSAQQPASYQNNQSASERAQPLLFGEPFLEKFTFDKMLVGNSNEEAVNAAKQMMDDNWQIRFNPLFIYGAVGFGKTHLLHAMGHYLRERHGDKKLLHLTAEYFLQHYVSVIRKKEIFSFENQFANIDGLFIDDLHFILNKEGATKALESIIGQFIDRGKMVVVVADRGVKELRLLGDRITSHLISGVATKLESPSCDMQKALLRFGAMTKGFQITDDAMQYLLKEINGGLENLSCGNVSPRFLSGVINKFCIHVNIQKTKGAIDSLVVDLPICQQVLLDIMRVEYKQMITVKTVQEMVAEYYDITVEDIKGDSRLSDIARPRQVAMYLAKNLTHRSLPTLGKQFNRDHTTVLHASRTVHKKMLDNPNFEKEVLFLTNKIKGSVLP